PILGFDSSVNQYYRSQSNSAFSPLFACALSMQVSFSEMPFSRTLQSTQPLALPLVNGYATVGRLIMWMSSRFVSAQLWVWPQISAFTCLRVVSTGHKSSVSVMPPAFGLA